jgi:hypothetical protein
MKRANLRELLTAAIDGELTPAERKTAQRLLRESEAARILLAQLKADASRLKKLPRVPAPAELAENVLNVIQERAIAPTPLPPVRRNTTRFNWAMVPIWVNLATAAAILIVISFGSYMYFAASRDYYANLDRSRDQAKERHLSLPAEGNKPGAIERGPQPKEVDPGSGALAQNSPKPESELGPRPRVVVPDFLADRPLENPEIEPFDLNKIRVSQLFDMHELPKDDSLRKKLSSEMKKDELIRLDLFCQTTPKALDFVAAGLKARGITAITDGFVQDRLRKKLPTELVIFTEALTPEEVAQLLTALGAEDVKNGAGEFETVVAAPFLPADLTRLGQLLGVPSVLPKPAKGKQGPDISKPLPEGTAQHVAATLAGMGTGSTARKLEKVAVVVAYSPMNPHPTTSKEIKQFLDRGERQAEAKPLMLVLRTTK